MIGIDPMMSIMAKRTMKQATISMKLMFICQNFGKDKQKQAIGSWQ
jgi:hypothetical protein